MLSDKGINLVLALKQWGSDIPEAMAQTGRALETPAISKQLGRASRRGPVPTLQLTGGGPNL